MAGELMLELSIFFSIFLFIINTPSRRVVFSCIRDQPKDNYFNFFYSLFQRKVKKYLYLRTLQVFDVIYSIFYLYFSSKCWLYSLL